MNSAPDLCDLLPDEVLDKGIKGTVEWLRHHGFRTFSSCQGGEGHGYRFPIVRMEPDLEKSGETTKTRLVDILLKAGCQGFTVRCEYSYASNGSAPSEGVDLEFWSLECIPKQ